MRAVRLLIGFDGTRYEGWQSQRKNCTIQECFEKILARLFKEKTTLYGSSRTDSGVHAEGFVAHFKTESALADLKIRDALNFYLPKDIVVYSAKTAPSGFHARFDARSKLYRYTIWNDPVRSLFEAPYVLWHPRALDVARMKKAAKYFIGRRDFSAFKDAGDERKSHVRTVKKLTVRKKGPRIEIDIEADGFLTHMARVVAGTLIDVGRGKISADSVSGILASKNRKNAGPTARAQGLKLLKVRY